MMREHGTVGWAEARVTRRCRVHGAVRAACARGGNLSCDRAGNLTADRVGTARAYDVRAGRRAGARLCPLYAPSVWATCGGG
jgi:hypothetical protein